MWLRCESCRHTALTRPEVLAQLIGCDCSLAAPLRRLRYRAGLSQG
jgi:hypothetical protein